jgi:FdhE protein
MECHYPPSMERINREIETHIHKNKDLAQLFKVYRKVLKAQLDHLNEIHVSVNLSGEEIKNCFRNGQYLMSKQKFFVDVDLFKNIFFSLCQAIKKASPGAPDSLQQLCDAKEFETDNLKDLLDKIKLFNKQKFEDFIKNIGMDKKTGVDGEIIVFVFFSALSPFYSLFTKEVRKIVDFSLWRRGYCPVCGQTAVIAKHRSEDGARVLHCWLCHAEWVYPRLVCPYCENKDQKQLRFFYVPGDKSRQVHVCEKCKKYLKTIDMKIIQKDVHLDVEAIATGYLDIVAEREGYRAPDEAALLN